jgi:anti-sigma factor RsiW
MDDSFVDEAKCAREDVAAYLDGELEGAALENFEAHLKSCSDCAAELRNQRQLLCTLEVAFAPSRSFELPKNFAKVVTTHAENDLSGMRKRGERRRALQVCVVLGVASFALLGAAARALVFDPARAFFRATASLAGLIWQTLYEAGFGIATVVRVVGRAVIFAPHGLGYLLLFTFLFSISLLFFLIAKYHRKQIIE